MDEDVQSIITSVIENASRDAREFLVDGKWVNIAQNIASQYNLNGQKSDLLKTDIIFSVADTSLQESFSELLAEDLEITPEIANKIASDVRIRIFSHTTKPLLDEGNEHLLPAGEEVRKEQPSQSAIPQEKPSIQETKQTPHIHVPEKSAVEKKLAELRKLGQGSVLEARYSGQDPYREPLQ